MKKSAVFIVVIILSIILIAATWYWLNIKNKGLNRENLQNKADATENAVGKNSEVQEAGTGNEYNMDGMAEFSTVVEGYYFERDFSFESDESGNPVIAGKNAAFVVLDFKDDAFKKSLQNGASQKISEDGHYIFTVQPGQGEKIDCDYLYPVDYKDDPLNIKDNRLKDSCYITISGNEHYIFNLGYIENGKINCVNYINSESCIDELTNRGIVSSALENPVKIELFFGERDYPVFNTEYKVRLSDK